MTTIFTAAATSLKSQRDALAYLTYQAIFAELPETRQEAHRKALVLNEEIRAEFTDLWKHAGAITDFIREPGSDNLLASVGSLIDVIERTSSKMGRGSQDQALVAVAQMTGAQLTEEVLHRRLSVIDESKTSPILPQG